MAAAKPSGGLPSAYQQVEWIEANTGPMIDTNKYAKLTTKIECGMQRMDNGSSGYPSFFGCLNPAILFSIQGTGTHAYITFGNSGEKVINDAAMRGSIHDIVVDNTHTAIDGVTKITYAATALVEDPSVHIGVFGRYKGGDDPYAAIWARCSYFKIFEGDSLVCDLVPCYRKSDNEIGMYDLVQKAFRTNVGTGAFTKGADV